MGVEALISVTVQELLSGTGLPHLETVLAKEELGAWAALPRVALLARLKELGVTRLVERQALANAFARAQRGEKPCWKVPVSAPATTHATPAKPHPLPNQPVFDSQAEPLGAPPSEETRRAVRHQLLSAAAEYEERGGLVRPALALPQWTEPFGECPDHNCGCNRMREPRVRRRFRNLVVARTVRQLAAQTGVASSVRYVTVGCGNLLSDVEILSGLVERGVRIDYIALVDSGYRSLGTSLQLFRSVATFFHPARVLAFDCLGDLRQAARKEPEVHARATTVCQIDANSVGTTDAKGLAARLLVPGQGQFFVLSNDGRQQAGRECWRRTSDPGPDETDPIRGLAPTATWATLLEHDELDEADTRVGPLGEVEPDDSWARPLWDADGEGGLPTGAPYHWQNRRENSAADMSDEALQAALNLL